MNTTSEWWHWQGELCRRAYLLTRTTALGWHSFNASGFCTQCHQHQEHRDPLCREFLVAIPEVSSPAHDAPLPSGRLF